VPTGSLPVGPGRPAACEIRTQVPGAALPPPLPRHPGAPPILLFPSPRLCCTVYGAPRHTCAVPQCNRRQLRPPLGEVCVMSSLTSRRPCTTAHTPTLRPTGTPQNKYPVRRVRAAQGFQSNIFEITAITTATTVAITQWSPHPRPAPAPAPRQVPVPRAAVAGCRSRPYAGKSPWSRSSRPPRSPSRRPRRTPTRTPPAPSRGVNGVRGPVPLAQPRRAAARPVLRHGILLGKARKRLPVRAFSRASVRAKICFVICSEKLGKARKSSSYSCELSKRAIEKLAASILCLNRAIENARGSILCLNCVGYALGVTVATLH